MDDRTLLEKAAKAAGIDAEWHNDDEADFDAAHEGMFLKGQRSPDNDKYWNPLRRDGDALRLAVKLKLDILNNSTFVAVEPYERDITVTEYYYDDPRAATRRCIVRAAASLGDKHE